MKFKRAIAHTDKRQREHDILCAALSLFAEQGFHATKMTDIASRVGLSKGTLYLYFANKDDLFRRLITQFAAEELMIILTQFNQEEDIKVALAQLSEDMIITLRDSPLPKLIRVLISEAAQFPEMVDFYKNQVIQHVHTVISTRLGDDANAQALTQLILAPFILTILSQEIIYANQPFDEIALRRLMNIQTTMIINFLANN